MTFEGDSKGTKICDFDVFLTKGGRTLILCLAGHLAEKSDGGGGDCSLLPTSFPKS